MYGTITLMFYALIGVTLQTQHSLASVIICQDAQLVSTSFHHDN
jgi:hypothetical protein